MHGIITRKGNNNKGTLWSEIEENFMMLEIFITLPRRIPLYSFSWGLFLYCETLKVCHWLLDIINPMLPLDGIIFYLE